MVGLSFFNERDIRLVGMILSDDPSKSVKSPPGLIPSLNITCLGTSDLTRPKISNIIDN
jgi:hypothetical protein